MPDVSKLRLDDVTYNVKDDNARTRLTNLETRRFVFIADSYGKSIGSDGYPTGWPGIAAKKLGLILNDTVVFNQAGGAGFRGYGTANKKFYDLLNEVTISNPNTVTDVVVCGGYNDAWYTDTDVYTGIHNFVTLSKTKFPNALIHIGHVGKTTDTDKIINLGYNVERYQKGANTEGAVYITGSEYAARDYFVDISSDKIHPTADGDIAIGNAIYNYLKTGACSKISSFKNVTLSIPSGITSSSLNAGYMRSTLHNGMVFLTSAANHSINFDPYLNYGYANGGDSNAIDLGEITGGHILGNVFLFNNILVPAIVNDGGVYKKADATIVIRNGHMYVILKALNSSGTTFETFSEIRVLTLSIFSAVFDALYC